MNFSEFTKSEVKTEGKKNRTFTEEDARKTYDELKDLSSDDLTKRLFSEVNRQKTEGTFNYDMLKSSVESLKNFLPAEKYENIKRLLENLR